VESLSIGVFKGRLERRSGPFQEKLVSQLAALPGRIDLRQLPKGLG